ncbi:unnamed protein product [Arabidopsis halleri]
MCQVGEIMASIYCPHGRRVCDNFVCLEHLNSCLCLHLNMTNVDCLSSFVKDFHTFFQKFKFLDPQFWIYH